jgi:hypothetical protein
MEVFVEERLGYATNMVATSERHVQGIGGEKAQVYLCREDVRMEGAGKVGRLHTLYNWGATVTLVTHAAAEKAGLNG